MSVDKDLGVSNVPVGPVCSPRVSRGIDWFAMAVDICRPTGDSPEPVTATSGEALEMWRSERLREASLRYDVLPPGLVERILDDTPEAMAERMRRNVL